MPEEIPYDFFDTPDPNELGFWVLVACHEITATNMPVAGVTTMTKFKMETPGRPAADYDDYVFLQSTPAATPGFRRFYFGKPKDEEARAVPFTTFPDWKDAEWHNVLMEVPLFVKDTNFLIASPFENNGTALVPRWYVRRKWLPGGFYRCLHIVEHFLSPIPFTEQELEGTPTPVPTDISVELPGLDFNPPKCLHPEVTAPELNTGLVVATEAGLSQPREGVRYDGQIFPATNVRRWDVRVLNEQQKTSSGLYFRERITIHPPQNVRVQRY